MIGLIAKSNSADVSRTQLLLRSAERIMSLKNHHIHLLGDVDWEGLPVVKLRMVSYLRMTDVANSGRSDRMSLGSILQVGNFQ